MPQVCTPPEVSSSASTERRADIRYLCHQDTGGPLVEALVAERWPAEVRDISTSGIAFWFSYALEPGITVGVELSNDDYDLSYTIPVRVVRAVEGDGRWLIGCAFVPPLSDEEVQSLL